MEIFNFSDNYEHLWISGDIHGEIRTLVYNLKRLKIRDAVVVVAGDCGIGFEKIGHYQNIYHRINVTLNKQNCILLFVRGNHDDPLFFKEKMLDFPRMKTIPDYSIISIGGKNILCIGGAVSLDRYERKKEIFDRQLRHKKDISIYWLDESPVYDEKKLFEIVKSKISINILVTHSAPQFCYPQIKRNFERRILFDPELFNDVEMERSTLDEIYNRLIEDNHPLEDWCYGHFHSSHIELINGIRFRLLDIEELAELF